VEWLKAKLHTDIANWYASQNSQWLKDILQNHVLRQLKNAANEPFSTSFCDVTFAPTVEIAGCTNDQNLHHSSSATPHSCNMVEII